MKKKNIFKKLLSLLLVAIITMSAIPFTGVQASAATAKATASLYTKNATIQKRLTTLFNNYKPGASYFTKNGKACTCHKKGSINCIEATHKDCNCIRRIKINGKNIDFRSSQCYAYAMYCEQILFGEFGYANSNSDFKQIGKNRKWNSPDDAKKWFEDYKTQLHPGTHIRGMYTDDPDKLHSICLLKVDYEKGYVYFIDCNWDGYCLVGTIKKYTWKQMDKRFTKIKYASVLKDYYKLYPDSAVPSVSISSVKNGEVTNTSATINVALNTSFAIDKWTYFLSTNKSAVSSVDGTLSSTHKSTSNMDCIRVKQYSPAQMKSSDSFVINKFQGKALKPDTTYYYKVTVKIGDVWYSSGVQSFKTSADKPAAPTLRVASGSEKIGIEGRATLLWDGAKGAESYTITLTNPAGMVYQTKGDIVGTTCVMEGFTEAGVYTATITAENGAGSTTGNTVDITVMDDVTVKFFDTISNEVIATDIVHYGGSASAPKNPVQQGHTFSKWDADFENVTENITVNTIYDKNSYTVKFIDSFTNKVLKKQPLKYGDNATPPEVEMPDGYELTGWSESIENVSADMSVYTVYKWADTEHNATVTIDSVKRNTTKQGYDVTVTLSNKVEEILSGRIVVALKSNDGVILTTTESAAFAVDKEENKTISLTVLYSELAPQIEVYAVNGYDTLGQLSKVASQSIDNSTATEWSPWITYTDTCPMTEDENTKVETQTLSNVTPTKTYYRYKIKETTTSKSTSLTGYTQNGYSLSKNSTGTVSYVPSWPSGFYTSNALYKKYNVKPRSASESATQKIVINSTATQGYIYWHWCKGESHGAINRWVEWKKSSTYDTFHAFYSTTAKSYYASGDAYQYKNTSACGDSYWWNGLKSGSAGLVTVKKQTYTVYDKVYNYYKLSDYSDWIEYTGTVPVANGDSAGTNKTYQNVETKTVEGVTEYTNQYRYMTTNNPVINEPAVNADRIVNISGTVDSNFAGKTATVWIYKYAQASDYTNEFVATTTIGENGEIVINNAVLREAPTVESGDYSIVAVVQGQARAIKIGTIEAPKPTYTVTFCDFDGSVISTQTVTQGENADLPEVSSLKIPAGQRFTNWSESVVNVRNDMIVRPESETKTFVVAFVNWEVQSVVLKEFKFGSELVADTIPEGKDGFITEWVVQVGDEYLTIEEFTEAGYMVTDNTVVVTRSTPKQYTVTIVDADKEKLLNSTVVENGDLDSLDIADSYTVTNGNNIDFSNVQQTIEESEDIIFVGWINAGTGEVVENTEVNESVVLYPSYTFAEDTVAPVSDIESGEYSENKTVTLTSETEKATIWYTLDGTDPTISSTVKEYTSPIVVSESCVLRYYATSVGKNDSEENSNVYAINTSGNPTYHVVTVNAIFEGDTQGYTPTSVGLVKDGTYLSQELFEAFEGYNLSGVYYDESCTEEFYVAYEVIDGSVNLYANYAPIKYLVEFIDYDGTVISAQNISYLESAILPEAPEREGFVFVGWNGDYEYITEATTITARYVSEEDYASVSLNRTRKITLPVGTTFANLKAVITPEIHSDYEVQWESADESIAEVDSTGVITAISAGETTITAILPYTNARASISVTVVHNPDVELVIKDTSAMGFDDWGYIRGVPMKSNSVSQIEVDFENEGLAFFSYNNKLLSDKDLIGTGSVVKLKDGETVLDEAMFILTGDVTGDGVVDVLDATMAQRVSSEKAVLEEPFMIALDSNADGEIDTIDYQTIINQVLSR